MFCQTIHYSLWPSADLRSISYIRWYLERNLQEQSTSDPQFSGKKSYKEPLGQTKQPHCNSSLSFGECMYQSIWIGWNTGKNQGKGETGSPLCLNTYILMGLQELSNFGPRTTVGFCQGTWQFGHMRPLTSSALRRVWYRRVWFRGFETFQKDAPFWLVRFYSPGH